MQTHRARVLLEHRKAHWRHITLDLLVLILSIFAAVFLVKSGVVHSLIHSFQDMSYIGSFFAGIFFTSMFTTIPAIAVLGELSQEIPAIHVAVLGGFGAVVGDYILFHFFKDRMSDDVSFLLKQVKLVRLPHLIKMRYVRSLMPFIGAMIIASPLPDELGIALMGFTRTSDRLFLPLAFSFNVLGILLIAWLAGGKF